MVLDKRTTPFSFHPSIQLPSVTPEATRITVQEDLTTPQSAASPTLTTQSRVNGLQIIMRPAASAPSLELSSSPKRATPSVPTPVKPGSKTTSRSCRSSEGPRHTGQEHNSES
ncbi:C-C motif chemokine ligand 14 [Rhinolophus ferrumequinum]|uniref:C-C motif chemokine ligand 14 n=1 Tax=Rhinolophus ferrumequinum TaxID=59479 RepID=A0A7J7TC04_RHIFE|nr:C-C motif chemokine ligand 14 [Rhinolophus ferrumequinum]